MAYINSIIDLANIRVQVIRKMSRKFKGVAHADRKSMAEEVFRNTLLNNFPGLIEELTVAGYDEFRRKAVDTVESYSKGHAKYLPDLQKTVEEGRELMASVIWKATEPKEQAKFKKRHERDEWWLENQHNYCPILNIKTFPMTSSLVEEGKYIGTRIPLEVNAIEVYGSWMIKEPGAELIKSREAKFGADPFAKPPIQSYGRASIDLDLDEVEDDALITLGPVDALTAFPWLADTSQKSIRMAWKQTLTSTADIHAVEILDASGLHSVTVKINENQSERFVKALRAKNFI